MLKGGGAGFIDDIMPSWCLLSLGQLWERFAILGDKIQQVVTCPSPWEGTSFFPWGRGHAEAGTSVTVSVLPMDSVRLPISWRWDVEWGFQRCDGCIHKVGGMTWWMMDKEDITAGSSQSAVFHASSLFPWLKTAPGACVKLLSAAGRWVSGSYPLPLVSSPGRLSFESFWDRKRRLLVHSLLLLLLNQGPAYQPVAQSSQEVGRKDVSLSTHPQQRQPQQGKGASRGVTAALPLPTSRTSVCTHRIDFISITCENVRVPYQTGTAANLTTLHYLPLHRQP